ncbi:MAG: hypothetical protein F6K23_08725 [Okeania sp. SIO2C9]|uniref:hypothetical protein n=1 Tax=Okeania sp. SIO2C9 TaxID=2607791 RepID=UPI0013C20C99|nr:hypothetical protein [Okeania sp. SIO2C9]NEQ73152.1 hypothetical protein [Okeania sp. SIO2C9]
MVVVHCNFFGNGIASISATIHHYDTGLPAIFLANPLTIPAAGAVAVVSLGILGYRSHLKGIARIEDAREVMVKEIDKHVARTKETIRFIHEASTKEYCLTLLNLCTQDIFSANTFITSLETRIDSDNSLIAKNLKFSSEAQEKLKNLRHTSDKLKNELDLFLDQSNSKLFLRNES